MSAVPHDPAPSRGLVRLMSGDYFGLQGRPVEVQVDVSSKASPGFSIVGLPGKSTRESRERIRTAIRNGGYRFPHSDRILVNLAPFFEEKKGAVFDLPVALGILLATAQGIPGHGQEDLTGFAFLGELGLEGELRPVPGALLVAAALREHGARTLVVPPANAGEVALLPDLLVFGVQNLEEALLAISGELTPWTRRPPAPSSARRSGPDFVDVRGQEGTKRALLIAAAGTHNTLFS